MAGTFWLSSHCQQWIMDPEELVRERQIDYQVLTDDEYQMLMICFANVIQSLGESLKVKQQVIATATVYFKRFYARNSLKSIDPVHMIPTCLLLAAKVEEFGIQSNHKIVSTYLSLSIFQSSIEKPNQLKTLVETVHECEFYLLEILDCSLIVYQPYRSLTHLAPEFGNPATEPLKTLLQDAWRILNDSLRTDVSLLFPPHLIALAALYMATLMSQRDLSLIKHGLAEMSVSMEKILQVCKHLMYFYDLMKNFNEAEMAAILSKVPKPRLATRNGIAASEESPQPVPTVSKQPTRN